MTDNLLSQGEGKDRPPFEFGDREYRPSSGYHWKVRLDGLQTLADKDRLIQVGNWLKYKRFLSDFGLVEINNIWTDTVPSTFRLEKIFAVQTPAKLVARCLLYGYRPRGLVFDPTCGSGTTAFVSEQHGRGWITADTSRVAINIARQRLLSSVFDHYKTLNGSPSSGLVYKTVDRVTQSLAYDLEPEKVELVDQPEESFGSIVLRHVNMGLARGYLHELKVKSRQGIEAAARQGRHAGGKPLYGYRFQEIPHPNPHKARQGGKQKILEPDPLRAPIVRMIFEDYVARGMSLGDLQSKLNADLERFPPPESPDPRRRTGRWGRSSVWEILRNPKFTRYQVWNRRARKRGGKTNPPEQWIWSEEPAHEALVSREMFEEVARRSVARDNVTKAARTRADYAPRTYLLRSFLRCGACGLRMHGRERHGVAYYTCETARRHATLVAPSARRWFT